MTSINQELYEALVAAGAPDDAAKRAAASILSHDQRTDLATKLDLEVLKQELRAEMWKTVGTQAIVLIGVMVALKIFA
jgi:hypothetical protein